MAIIQASGDGEAVEVVGRGQVLEKFLKVEPAGFAED